MKRLKVHHYEITVCADQRDTLRYLSMRSYQRLSYCCPASQRRSTGKGMLMLDGLNSEIGKSIDVV